MARANQAGSFGPSRTRTSLVVYRIAKFHRGWRQAVIWERRRWWHNRVSLRRRRVAVHVHAFIGANAAVLIHHVRGVPSRTVFVLYLNKFLSHFQFLPLFFPGFDFPWVHISSVWILLFLFPVLPLLFHNILGVLKHFLFPKVKEIGRIRVEFKCLLAIVPIRGKYVERWRSIAGPIGFKDRHWQRISVEELLVLSSGAFEGLPGVNALQGDFLLFGIQLSDFDLQAVNSLDKNAHTGGKGVGLSKQLSKYVFCKFTQAAQLSNDICQGDVGHAFQLASNARQRLTAQVPWLNVPRY